jgi:hypothetical protein
VIPKNTRVIATIGDLPMIGVVVGKAINTIEESYIIRCDDGQLPNNVYVYGTFISRRRYITVLDTSFETWAKFDKDQQNIITEMARRNEQ